MLSVNCHIVNWRIYYAAQRSRETDSEGAERSAKP
jgi:hypothetical protein